MNVGIFVIFGILKQVKGYAEIIYGILLNILDNRHGQN